MLFDTRFEYLWISVDVPGSFHGHFGYGAFAFMMTNWDISSILTKCSEYAHDSLTGRSF